MILLARFLFQQAVANCKSVILLTPLLIPAKQMSPVLAVNFY